jgi:DNA-binding MurR/RpiR family transcriptional regulator
VSKATIVRLAQRLGYRGFTELQRELSGALQSDLSNVRQIIGTIEEHAAEDTLQRVGDIEVRNVQETISHIDRGVFREIVRMLIRARRVYTVGSGISELLAELTAYDLHQVAIDARPSHSLPMHAVEMLSLAGPADVVIAFSLPPYTRQTIDTITHIRKRGVPVIAFTDMMTSPITFHADQVIVVQTKNMMYTNSITAVSAVMNALVTEIALKNKNIVASVLQDVGKALDETDHYLLKRESKRRRIP